VKREVTPEFVNMSKEILYPQIQGVTGPAEAKRTHYQACGQLKGPRSAGQQSCGP
jgi:hypothetical protein